MRVFTLVFLALVSSGAFALSEETKRPNILFISVDDLRPELGCYGAPLVKSPHIDKLAARGTLFTRAYCNIPVCGASRASLMTGIRPTRSRFVSYDTRLDRDTPEAVTLSQHFKENGYQALSYGKVQHFPDDRAETWSEIPWRPDYPVYDGEQKDWRNYLSLENRTIASTQKDGRALPWEKIDVPDEAYFDGGIAKKAADFLTDSRSQERPFFLAVGFFKPHLPFNAPSKYWDLYDPSQFSLPKNYHPPFEAPKIAIHNFGELRQYYGVPRKGPLNEEMALKLVHGYHACVSYTDALIGTVLDALKKGGHDDNTIIVLWGDHGWNLGEHSLWCKHSNFRSSLRVPLLVITPGMPEGKRCDALVELVDVFPSLVELTNTKPPKTLQGDSFRAQLLDSEAPGKREIFSQWKSGATVKTNRHIFTQYLGRKGNILGEMLYDHHEDIEENTNLVEEQPEIANELRERLPRGKQLAEMPE